MALRVKKQDFECLSAAIKKAFFALDSDPDCGKTADITEAISCLAEAKDFVKAIKLHDDARRFRRRATAIGRLNHPCEI